MMGGAWFLNHPDGAAPVPARDGQRRRRRRTPPRGTSRSQLGARGRVVQLHRRARRTSTSCSSSTRTRTTSRTASAARRRPPDRLVLELRRRAPLLHRARPQGQLLVRARLPRPHPRRDRVGRRARRRATAGPTATGLPTDASFDKVTLDDTTENPMEIAVDARRQRLLRRARRHGQALQRAPPATSARSARSRCTAATRTACSGSRSTRTSTPTAGCTSSTARRRPRSSTSRASRVARRRHDRHGLGEGAAASSRTSGSSAATRPAR